MVEIAKQFRFDSAHTLDRVIDAEGSRRVHGHSYRAEVVIAGTPDPASGMVMDLAALDAILAPVRDALDHRLLDEVPDLGPATLENIAQWVVQKLRPSLPNLSRVTIFRDSHGERCTYTVPQDAG